LKKLRAILLAALAFGAGLVAAPRLMAVPFVQDTPPAPIISLTPEQILHFWSAQALTRGVTNDAQWATAMNTLFATATSPGMDPTALAFLRSFFIQYVHVGVP
jgi:hypothetical protein